MDVVGHMHGILSEMREVYSILLYCTFFSELENVLGDVGPLKRCMAKLLS